MTEQFKFDQFGTFFQRGNTVQYRSWTSSRLILLQKALHFRGVTVASDEAICIANLLRLDIGYVLEVSDSEARMARVWELISQQNSHRLPANLVFLFDDTLDLPGWRWAPRTLMQASTSDSAMNLSERIMRLFDTEPLGPGASNEGAIVLAEGDDTIGTKCAVPRSLGFRVQLSGWLLKPGSRCASGELHPWEDLILPIEDRVVVRNEADGKFMNIIDYYRGQKSASWTEEERKSYNRTVGRLLCNAIDTAVVPLYATLSLMSLRRVRWSCLKRVTAQITQVL